MTSLTTSHLYREIHEQPEVLARLLANGWDVARRLAAAIRERQIEYVVIAARGTSDNAARYAQYVLGGRNRLPVGLATPSLFTIYKTPPRFGRALVLGISQSGQSPDIVAVLAEARRQGVLTAALTNAPTSPLAQVADEVLDLAAGAEHAIAATKTYTAQLAAVALLSVALDGDEEAISLLRRVPDWVAQALRVEEQVARVAERYRHRQACVIIGRGYNYATAFELALKLKELTYTVVEAYSSADFLHGPFALIEPGFPLIVIAPSGPMMPEMLAFMAKVTARQAELLVLSDAPAALAPAQMALPLPTGVPEWLSPLTAIVPGQLLALYLAQARHLDPDRPRGLRKVTVTR